MNKYLVCIKGRCSLENDSSDILMALHNYLGYDGQDNYGFIYKGDSATIKKIHKVVEFKEYSRVVLGNNKAGITLIVNIPKEVEALNE